MRELDDGNYGHWLLPHEIPQIPPDIFTAEGMNAATVAVDTGPVLLAPDDRGTQQQRANAQEQELIPKVLSSYAIVGPDRDCERTASAIANLRAERSEFPGE
jgi:hypothetical protein